MHLIFLPKFIPYFVEYKVRAKNLYFKEDLVVALVSRHVNLSIHPNCAIQKPLRINTQSQLQSSESHHTLASPTQAPHHLPVTHLQSYVFLAIFFSNLERMFVNMCPFSNHQD